MSTTHITVLHDAFGRDLPALRKEWGFAALVEIDGQRILFDTGNGLRTFADNAEALGVDLHSLDFAVISHRHGDHTTGIAHLLTLCPKLPIYVPQEIYGVFGSSLPGTFFPRCHSLPAYMSYYDGKPPEAIQHGTPWPDAHFTHVTEVVEAAPNIFIVPVVSDVPGTRELRELSLAIRNSDGVILLVGCSHPGIERILDACRAVSKTTRAIVGGLHWVLTPEAEIQARAKALRDTWGVRHIAPGHCTGELAFAALRDVFQENYLFAGLGEALSFVADA